MVPIITVVFMEDNFCLTILSGLSSMALLTALATGRNRGASRQYIKLLI